MGHNKHAGAGSPQGHRGNQCYIHPAIIEAYQAGQLGQLRRARKRRWLSAEEATLLAFLDAPG